MSLSVPEMLPNGKTLVVDNDFYQRLHFGDASLGWLGDVNLGVYHENGRIEVWRWCEDGEPRLIVRSRPGMARLDSGLLRFLAAHDTQRRGGFDPKAHVDSHNARVEAQRQVDLDARFEEAADKLHYAIRKDFGSHIGGLTKRQYSLPAAPWKKEQ